MRVYFYVYINELLKEPEMNEISLEKYFESDNSVFPKNYVIWLEYRGNNETLTKIFNAFKEYILRAKGGGPYLNSSAPNARKDVAVMAKYLAGVMSQVDRSFDAYSFFENHAVENIGKTGGYRFSIEKGESAKKAFLSINEFFLSKDVHDFFKNTFVVGSEEYSGRNNKGELIRKSYSYYLNKDKLEGDNIGLQATELETNESNVLSNVRNWSLNKVLEGVAGCGKTHYLNNLLSREDSNADISFKPENSEIVVFHPSTSYEDFVSGLRPQPNGSFLGKAGIFVDLCNRAAAAAAIGSEEKFLLFIDEINRANTARVFGDLMMVIEDGKRAFARDLPGRAVLKREETYKHNTVHLQTPVHMEDGNDYEYLAVPDNLYIVGTMNSTDRSVGTIDLALRRRFTWHTMEPFSTKGDFKSEKIADNCDDLIDWFLRANKTLHKEVGPDARLGHSYFFGKDKSAEQVAHDLLKQLAEIAYIFHLDNLITKEPLNESVEGWKVEMQGAGLGQRPVVVRASQPDDMAPEEDKQEEQTAEGTVEQVTEAE